MAQLKLVPSRDTNSASQRPTGVQIDPDIWQLIGPIAQAVEGSLDGRSTMGRRAAIVSGMMVSWHEGRRMPLDLVSAGLSGAGA